MASRPQACASMLSLWVAHPWPRSPCFRQFPCVLALTVACVARMEQLSKSSVTGSPAHLLPSNLRPRCQTRAELCPCTSVMRNRLFSLHAHSTHQTGVCMGQERLQQRPRPPLPPRSVLSTCRVGTACLTPHMQTGWKGVVPSMAPQVRLSG